MRKLISSFVHSHHQQQLGNDVKIPSYKISRRETFQSENLN